jgi:hypothetical protein
MTTLPCRANPDGHFLTDATSIAEAKAACGGCPARAACLERALAGNEVTA